MGLRLSSRRLTMELLITIFLAIAGLAAFDLAAMTWGADSRDRLGDTHHR